MNTLTTLKDPYCLDVLKEFVDKILSNNSRNFKISILEEYKDSNIIKYFLNYIYNPYITTGISKKKIDKGFSFSKNECGENTDYNVISVLEYFKENNSGSYLDLKRFMAYYYKELEGNDELSTLFFSVLSKDLSLGVDVKTINKVFKNLIPEFSVMLANKYFEKPEAVEGKDFYITNKIDGGRIIAIKKNNEVSFFTRSGQKYLQLIELEEEMINKLPDNICLDGEITLLNKGNLVSKEQYKETMKIVRKDGEKVGVKMLVFDIMTADEFYSKKCDKTYKERRSMLDELLNYNLNYFEVLDVLYEGNDSSKITEILKTQVSKGEEGIMINLSNGLYEFKRSNNLLKCKLMDSIDLEVISYEEGKGKFSSMLGAFIVSYKGHELRVGSGFSKELREEIWKDRDSYIGKTIEIQYFEETTNQKGEKSLRFPVFLDIRYDK